LTLKHSKYIIEARLYVVEEPISLLGMKSLLTTNYLPVSFPGS